MSNCIEHEQSSQRASTTGREGVDAASKRDRSSAEPRSASASVSHGPGWGDYLSTWEEYRTLVDEYRELDDRRMLVLYTFCGLGHASGLEVRQMQTKNAGLFRVRDGKCRGSSSTGTASAHSSTSASPRTAFTAASAMDDTGVPTPTT
jgi:hypothetical protein